MHSHSRRGRVQRWYLLCLHGQVLALPHLLPACLLKDVTHAATKELIENVLCTHTPSKREPARRKARTKRPLSIVHAIHALWTNLPK